MKTFMEEYGLIILAILVVGALIALAIAFNTKATKDATAAFENFTKMSSDAIKDANSGANNGANNGSSEATEDTKH